MAYMVANAEHLQLHAQQAFLLLTNTLNHTRLYLQVCNSAGQAS